MKPLPDKFPAGLRMALQALYSTAPVTDADMAEHRRLVAAEMARAEARRRKDTPQRVMPL